MFSRYNFWIFLILFSLFFITCGIILEKTKPSFYSKFREAAYHVYKGNLDDASYYLLGKNLYNVEKKLEKIGLIKCNIPKVNYSDFHSVRNSQYSLIIGHAYGGSDGIKSGFISNNLIDFFKKNKIKFDRIYFTGDVFNEPSLKKWKKFMRFIKKNADINEFIIIPGNHDVGFEDNTKRDVFFQIFDKKFPNLEKRYNNYIISIDTTIRPFSLDEKVIDLILNLKSEDKLSNLFILAHHILRPYPITIANATYGLKSTTLNDLQKINQKLEKFKNVYFISGDAGNNISFDCFKNKNIHFISSGLGNYKEKNIILFDETIGSISLLNLQ